MTLEQWNEALAREPADSPLYGARMTVFIPPDSFDISIPAGRDTVACAKRLQEIAIPKRENIGLFRRV